MASDDKSAAVDVWSQWLLHLRDAGDPQLQQSVRTLVDRYVDRLLEAARLAPGDTLVDVGSGEGLVAFRAIERIGPNLRVWLTDVSEPMLRHAESRAIERGVRGQCTFLRAAADRLEGVADASVDVVTCCCIAGRLRSIPIRRRRSASALSPTTPSGTCCASRAARASSMCIWSCTSTCMLYLTARAP